MLNCCIHHKLKRQQQQQPVGDAKSSDSGSSKNLDEFFDCYEDTTEIDSATAAKPEGRLRPLASDAFLLQDSSEPLYIPVTQVRLSHWRLGAWMAIFINLRLFQDPAPVTEDTLEQYGRMLTSMGTSDESAFARAKMQTPSLLSDMEAFKVGLIFSFTSP